jgi:hypothetical protein
VEFDALARAARRTTGCIRDVPGGVMKTLPLILLLGAVLAALYVLYLRREGRRRIGQGRLYAPLADRFGLTLFTLENTAGLYMWPELGGTYRGREVRVRGGVEFDPRLGDYDRMFRKLSGASGPRLRGVPKGEFTYVEVKCANPSGLAFYVASDLSGPKGGTEFERRFLLRFGEGGELPDPMILDEAIRRELLSTVAAGRPQPFERLALVGDGLLYIETGRIKTAGQAERFARMIDRLCDLADKVDSMPQPMPGVGSQTGGALSFTQER